MLTTIPFLLNVKLNMVRRFEKIFNNWKKIFKVVEIVVEPAVLNDA